MNLLDTVKGYLGDETIGRVASTLGIDPGTAKSAISAAAPTLLAGVAQTANSGEDGARRVATAVDSADEAAPDDFGRALASGGGAEVQSMTQSGASMLSNLFGRNVTGGFVGAISRYTGLGGGVAGKLIGLVTPVVFGALKRQKTSMGLDAGGLANLLSSQKSSFLSAIPSGLSGILSSVPGLSALTGTAGAAAASARGYATSAGETVRDTGYAAAHAAHHPKSSYWWVGPAVLCAVVLIGIWWWMGYRAESERRATVPPRQQPAPTVATPAAPVPEDMASQASARIGAGADTATGMTSQVSDLFTSATGTFGQVHDAASAEAAVPKFEAINERLDAMSQSMKALPADGRTKVSASVRQWREKLGPVTDKALAVPGAGEKLRPAVDEMYKKMDAMTAAE